VHTGEIEPVDGDVHGLTVHEAARILGVAGPGEVLVSEITRAVSAAEFSFSDRGVHDLKGIGPRRLYAVARAGNPDG
jgi:class 3 adenylate cyclase